MRELKAKNAETFFFLSQFNCIYTNEYTTDAPMKRYLTDMIKEDSDHPVQSDQSYTFA